MIAEVTKAWILYAVEMEVGGPHSTDVFTAEDVVNVVERALNGLTDAPAGTPPPRRVLGNCIDRYGREHTISEQTPVNVLLDVIELINAGGLVSRNGSDAATPAGGHKTIDDILAKVADIERLLNIRD